MSAKNADKYNSPFAVRLRDIIKEKNTTITAVAEHIGVTRQAVSQYCDGSTQPNADTIVKMADFFEVDCDYLLRGVSSENLSISEELGLSEKSINILKALKRLDDTRAEHDRIIYDSRVVTERFMPSFNAFIEAFEHSMIIDSFIEATSFSETISDFDFDDPQTYQIFGAQIKDNPYKKAEMIQNFALSKAILEAHGCRFLSPREAHEYRKEKITRTIAEFAEAALFRKTKNDFDNLKYWSILNNLRISGEECSVFEYVDKKISSTLTTIKHYQYSMSKKGVEHANDHETE